MIRGVDKRLDRTFGRLLIIGALGLLIIAAVLIGTGPQAPGPETSPASVASAAEAAVQASRPAEVGNQAAEAFLRKLDRPTGIPASGRIRISDELFSAAYDELYDHRAAYYGRDIELAGYVELQEDLGPGSFLVGRKLLWCCEEDAYFIGFLVLGAEGVPATGSAVRVAGRIEAASYTNPENGKSFEVPAIRVSSIEAASDIPMKVFPTAN